VTGVLDAGRQAFHRRAWREAYAHLSAADEIGQLDREDLERLAVAAHLLGSPDSADLWTRAHRECLAAGAARRAVWCAFWLAYWLLDHGELARGEGWLIRARKLVADGALDGPEPGYLLILQAIALASEDPNRALEVFTAAVETGERLADSGLAALGRMGQGQVLIALERWAEAVRALDEAMVATTSEELPPLVAGNVYCGAIDACRTIFDIGRTREWTVALSRWCDSQPDLVPFRGECLVHRVEIMQLHGDWADAIAEADRACQLLSGRAACGEALYRAAELYRLRGDVTAAETAYRKASRAGRDPQPGLALLRLAQGRLDVAAAAIRRVLAETAHPARRAGLLGAYVEVLLATGDIDAAGAGADELHALAGALGSTQLHALAAGARGAVLLAKDEPGAGLPHLRRAWSAWRAMDAPYEAARIRVLIGAACRAMGDSDGANLDLDAARLAFEALGATLDAGRVDRLLAERAELAHCLTGRELEVLALVAKGQTNREIATALVLSEHTVARHVQNIFAKLGVRSRTEVSSYAYQHGLV
jgi:DNA-binding CsgD family transcriptional regulator